MSDLPVSRPKAVLPFRRFRQRRPNLVTFGIAALVYAGVSWAIVRTQNVDQVSLRIDLSPLLTIPHVLQAHIAGALTAFLIGIVLLLGVKGRTFHKVLGYAWITAMAVTAISSFFLTGINGNYYSPIHLLSGWTVIVLPMAIAAARRRNIQSHSRQMTETFVGGMLIAGLFSFLPGRFMWHLFFTA